MFLVTILGSSAAMPTPTRNQTSQIITIENTRFLVDCGDGTFVQILRNGVSTKNLKYIFISHLHTDHFTGLMAFLVCLGMQSRHSPLYIYAPADLEQYINLHLKISQTTLDYEIIFQALPEGKSEVFLETAHFSVQNLPLEHRIKPCNGFLFTKKNPKRTILAEKLPKNLLPKYYIDLQAGIDVKNENDEILFSVEDYTILLPECKYAYCSDTKYNTELLPLIQNVDVLYHEATFLHKDAQKANNTYHSTALEAAQMAQQANAKQLLLGHFSIRYHDSKPFLEEAKSIFPNTYLAEDGVSFEIQLGEREKE